MTGKSTRRVSYLRALANWLAVLAVTVLMGEFACRFILGIQPLTMESLVWRYDPRWGWHHEPNTEDTFVKLGFRQSVRINSLGLREREIPHEKPPHLKRVLVIGDSSVASFEVPPEAAFTRIAEDRLRALGYSVEFVNGGCRGYGTDQSLLFLLDEGIRYQPDLVLYKWTDNDREDNATVHRPFRKFGKPYFDLESDGSLALRGVPVPVYPYAANLRVAEDGRVQELPVSQRNLITLWLRDLLVCRSSFATGLLKLAVALPSATGTLVQMGSYDDTQDVRGKFDSESRLFRVTSAMLREMRRVAEASGAEFRVIGASGEWGERLMQEIGLPQLGEMERYRAQIPADQPVHVPYDPHWNVLGHRIFGEALAQALVDADVLGSPGDAAATRSAGR